jgi:hypothetical protein
MRTDTHAFELEWYKFPYKSNVKAALQAGAVLGIRDHHMNGRLFSTAGSYEEGSLSGETVSEHKCCRWESQDESRAPE